MHQYLRPSGEKRQWTFPIYDFSLSELVCTMSYQPTQHTLNIWIIPSFTVVVGDCGWYKSFKPAPLILSAQCRSHRSQV